MRTLKEYLTESAKRYDFRIKLAHDVSPEHEAKLKTMLERFSVADFKKIGKTPVQELPLDFPKLRNREVTVFEVSLEYPTTQFELTEYVSQGLEIAKEGIVVRKPGEALEEYQTPSEKRNGALLDDPEYKEAGSPKFEDYYGEKYNASFLKSLNDDAKRRREERGEVIPGALEHNDLNTIPQNNTSPIKQTDYDPRKK
jgi:hypothetical protein